MKLFDFAFCYDYERKIQALAEICPEKWSFGSNSDNTILKNYIEHTFFKLLEEDKILEMDNYALFNTGLFTIYYEAIFAYFEKNKNTDRQKWFLNGFNTSYQLGMLNVNMNYLLSVEKDFVIRAAYNAVVRYRRLCLFRRQGSFWRHGITKLFTNIKKDVDFLTFVVYILVMG